MNWQILGAIAATITVIINIVLFLVVPAIRKTKRNNPLRIISEIKHQAVNLQNKYNIPLYSDGEFFSFKEQTEKLKSDLLKEIGEISKPLERQYRDFGAVDISMFLHIQQTATPHADEQVILLGIVKRCWELADKIVDKYS
jgi:hypothetical protein